MEYGLGVTAYDASNNVIGVLILVLMEDGLGEPNGVSC